MIYFSRYKEQYPSRESTAKPEESYFDQRATTDYGKKDVEHDWKLVDK